MHDGVAGLQGHMPTPDPELTKALQSALSDHDSGTHFCMAGAQDVDLNEVKHSVTFLRSANSQMDQVTSIIDRDLGRQRNVRTAVCLRCAAVCFAAVVLVVLAFST